MWSTVAHHVARCLANSSAHKRSTHTLALVAVGGGVGVAVGADWYFSRREAQPTSREPRLDTSSAPSDPTLRMPVDTASNATTTLSSISMFPINVVQNEAIHVPHGATPQPNSKKRASTMQRHATLRRLESMAAKDTVTSRYQADWNKPLGEGTFGAVFAAIDRKTGEKVAIKKIPKKFTDNSSFQREMDALLQVRHNGGHPNICGMRENFDEMGYYYLVLDFVDGGELFDHLVAQGAYSEADAARLVRESASALAFMHGVGVVHGDIKPENLMLSSKHTSDAAIKIVDFGCAQTTDPETKKTNKCDKANTPAYSPPEVLNKRRRRSEIDPSFDMWALGVIIYILLTGIHPFDIYGNASDEDIEEQIVSGKMPPLRKSPLTAHLSEDAISVIANLLQYKPNKRLSAHELLGHSWVRGKTARTSKMADSDKRLNAYRAFKTKLEAKVFADMVSWSEEDDESDSVAKRTSLIERAFHHLDPSHRGYVTSGELRKLTKHSDSAGSGDGDDQLSLSGFSDLLAENLKNKYFPKGHIVYKEGEKGKVMFFINSGTVEVFTKDGFTKTLRKPGDFFGEGALLHPTNRRSASIRCVTPVHAIEVSQEYFEKYLASEEGAKLNLREIDKTRKRQRAKAILQLQKDMPERVLKEGDYIFKRGEEGNEMYLIESGEVEILAGDSLQHVLTLKHGEMTGEHSMVFGKPRNVSARCASPKCKLHALRSPQFQALLDLHPTFRESVREMCLRREFQKALCVQTKKSFPRKSDDLRVAFNAVDRNGSGTIELQEMRNIIMQFDSSYTEQDVKDILSSLDLDESGKISWAEFKRIFGMDKD